MHGLPSYRGRSKRNHFYAEPVHSWYSSLELIIWIKFTVKPMRKITLRDIANESGVSVTAVSLAMRGSKRVSPDKAREIHDVAERLGYTRDPMMSALCAYRDTVRPRNKNANINFLQFGDEFQSMLNQGKVVGDFWKGALRETKLLGYNLNTTWAGDPSLNPDRLKNILNSRGVTGLIVYQSNCPIRYFEPALKDFSLIWLGDGPKGASLNSVRINRFSSMKLAWENLSKLGYLNGGLILVDHSLDQNYGEWEAAHNHFQRQFTGHTDYIPLLTFKSNQDCDPAILAEWITRWKPQVVISTFMNIYPLLQGLKLKIPKDIGYLSLSTEQDNDISGIDQQTESIAQTGVRLLDRQIINREQGIPAHQQIIETNGEWNRGRTLKQQN